MTEAQEHAAAAALGQLGSEVKITPTGARIVDLVSGAPATRVLRRGDVIVEADRSPVTKETDLGPIVRRHRIGDEILLKVTRGADVVTVHVKTIADPQNPDRPIIGIADLDSVPRVDLPLAVDIDSLGIGGPSAGLMYALGIVDLLDTEDLAAGRVIAGTGTITVDGNVEPVGGIAQKLAGAREAGAKLFLAPLRELLEACSFAGDMPVVGVEHLKDAVDALRGKRPGPGRSC
jgi:Lon-like protease